MRHTAYGPSGDELFHIKSERPYGGIRKPWHGYTLYTALGAFLQHAKHVDVLKRRAEDESLP